MGYKGIICPVCGSNLVEEIENGRLKCASCGTVIENESTFSDTNAIMSYLDGSQFETAENYCRDALARNGESHPILNWLLFLAKNKIHFVNDPKTNERKPVFYSERVFKRDCVFDDENYNLAIQGKYHSKYQHFGELIEAIRMGLCEKISEEADTDIFISFKSTEEVTDSEGKIRSVETFDQKKGWEIYNYFTSKGYKVFFSPVSIGKGNVLGQMYEPKIFAALASCRAMILIGTKKSYITDGWVRDEWTRYLYFMKNCKNKKSSRLNKANDSLFYVFDKQPPADLPSQIAEIEGVDCSSAYYLDDLYKAIKARIGNVNNGIERISIEKGERIKKEKVDIESIKTIALGNGAIAKKQTKIAGNLEVKEFGENKVDYFDADTQKILDGAFTSLEEGNFNFARHEFDDVLSTADNATALYGKILLTIEAKNEEEFAKNAEKFPKSEISLFHKLMSCASKAEAEKATDLFVSACKQCCADVETREAVMFFNAVVEYNIPQRTDAIKTLKEAIPSLIKAHDPNLQDAINAFLSTIAPNKVDLYIKECVNIVKCAIKESSFSVAEVYNNKILELDENNHDAMACRIYIQTHSRDSEELKNKINTVKIDDIEYIVIHSSVKNADYDLGFFAYAYLDRMNVAEEVGKSAQSLQVLLKYDFTARKKVLSMLFFLVSDKAQYLTVEQFETITDFFLANYDSAAVDDYIYCALKVADVSLKKGWWNVAKKNYRKVIDIDNANLQALYGALFADIEIGDDSIVNAVAKFADKDGTAIKDLENLLKFSLNTGAKVEDNLQFNNLINKFSDDILTALRTGAVAPDIADSAYLNVIRYIPQSDKALMRKRLLAISSVLLPLKKFELANKYYNQILLDKNDDFDALWGLVLCDAECRNNEELENTDYDFAETKNYIRAYRAADHEEQNRLNGICKKWKELKEKRKFKPLTGVIMKKLGVSCERDIIKSPKLLSTIPEFSQLMQVGNEYIISKYRFIETLQKQYNDLEIEIQKKEQEIKEIKDADYKSNYENTLNKNKTLLEKEQQKLLGLFDAVKSEDNFESAECDENQNKIKKIIDSQIIEEVSLYNNVVKKKKEKRKKYYTTTVVLLVVIIVAIFFIVIFNVSPLSSVDVEGCAFKKKSDGTYELSNFQKDTVTEFVIPEKVRGRAVTSIGDDAFV